VEHPLTIGLTDRPLFEVGDVATDAPFAAGAARLPVILLSHGFGGTARMMGWFGIALARDGYVVVAVDHPGNNGIDAMTVAGANLWWDRVDDLRAALAAVQADPVIGPHVDASRVGIAGFSAGGFTALVAAGARADPARLSAFCAATPDDGICRPQLEFQMTPAEVEKTLALPEVAADVAHAGDDHAIANVRAVFAMAPALVQALDPASLAAMRVPVGIILGDADAVAPPATNGLVAARAIPGATLERLPGVGHYEFLSVCTAAGLVLVPQCKIAGPQSDAHRQAIAAAEALFARTVGK
jgi:predicted dienelactone hydrolase